jgi:Nucleotidyl transferase AbiEii toxin, Type IV TA system
VITSLVGVIAQLPLGDGVEYLTETATSRVIRDQATYSGVRVAMDGTIATAAVKFKLDVSFGDPITPAPRWVTLPSIRPGLEPIRVLGYPVETVLAEKIATAIALGPANTRVRDYADIYTLSGNLAIAHRTARKALLATLAYRETAVGPLSDAIGNIADLRGRTYDAYRASLGNIGLQLPTEFHDVVRAVTAFADPLLTASGSAIWHPAQHRWTAASSRVPNNP